MRCGAFGCATAFHYAHQGLGNSTPARTPTATTQNWESVHSTGVAIPIIGASWASHARAWVSLRLPQSGHVFSPCLLRRIQRIQRGLGRSGLLACGIQCRRHRGPDHRHVRDARPGDGPVHRVTELSPPVPDSTEPLQLHWAGRAGGAVVWGRTPLHPIPDIGSHGGRSWPKRWTTAGPRRAATL